MTLEQAEQLLYVLENDRPRPMPVVQAKALVQEIIRLHQELQTLSAGA